MSRSEMKENELVETKVKGIMPGTILGNGRFLVGQELGVGGFGEIFEAVDKHNNDQPVAVKVCRAENQERTVTAKELKEAANTTNAQTNQFPATCHWDLIVEYNVMSHMENVKGFPKVYEIGEYKGDTYLVMELLGPSLSKMFREKNKTFSIKTLLVILDQLLERLKMLHSRGIVHGDFTPNNILFGTGDNHGVLYLIDFGLSSMFMDLETGKHFSKRKQQMGVGGTPRYMSVNVHQGLQRSRRDDMMSLVYVMAHFTTHGQLPWEKFQEQGNYKETEKIKRNIKCDQLFDGYPREFAIFMKAVQNLKYNAEPNYDEYRFHFRRLGTIFGIKYADGDEQKLLF